jgi:predicted DNA-binding transcriptional regulator AlpA
MEEKVLTLEEVAELLRTHPSTIYRLLRNVAFQLSKWVVIGVLIGKQLING